MKIRHFALAILLIATSFHLHAVNVFPPLTKMPARGITLTSPDEKGWFVFDPDGKGGSLVKVGASKSESYAITITHYPSPRFKSEAEFLDQVKQMNTTSPDRFKMRTTKEELDHSRGAYFASYYGLAEDHGAHQMPKGKSYALLETMGFYARHPNDPGLIIQVEYSYRYYPGHEDQEFKKKAEWVLINAVFTKP